MRPPEITNATEGIQPSTADTITAEDVHQMIEAVVTTGGVAEQSPSYLVIDQGDVVPEETGPVVETAPGLPATLVTKKVMTTYTVSPESLAPFVDKVTAAHKRKVESLLESARGYGQDAEHYLTRAKEYQQDAKEARKKAREKAREAKKESARVIPAVDMAPVMARLERHKAIEFMKINNGSLVIYLKPLWVDAQIKEGERDRTRTFIGCYRITINTGHDVDIRIHNLTFPDWYAHWSVSHGDNQPCWGDWRDQIRALWQEGKMVELVTMLVAYLSSTEDGSAYARTFMFREKRLEQIIVDGVKERPTPYNEWHPGRVFVYGGHSTDASGNRLHTLPARAYGRGRGSAHFLAPVNCNHHQDHADGYRDRDWHISGPYYWLTPDQEVELEALREELKDVAGPDHRSKLREWGQKVIDGQPAFGDYREEARAKLLAILDAAPELDYKTVAQRLVIDTKKTA